MKNNKTLSKLNSYIAGNRKYLILVIISALLANIFMLVAPYISGRAIDFIKGENNVDFPMVAKIIGILFAVYVLNALFTWGMTVFTNALSNHSIEKMRKDAFGKISKLPLKFFDGHSHGDIISRLTNDIDAVSEGLLQGITQLFSGIVTVVGSLVLMFLLDWRITLCVIVITIICIFVSKAIATNSGKMFRLQAQTIGELNGYVSETVGNLKVVMFKDVDFSYNKDKELIKDLNIVAKPGQRVAIVGPTGAGKTTIVNLLMNFYGVDKGTIFVDGQAIDSVQRDSLRKNFGMVLQDTWLFAGTVKENIAYGKEGATDEEIINAAKAASAHGFIKRLPNGYDTMITEDGGNLSSGQKQLLTIARAMLSDPKILILDEATSNVDTMTEQRIQKAFLKMMEGRTSFIIAHRLSTIREADLILVMDKGRIIEQGTHNELLAKNGFYTKLYNS